MKPILLFMVSCICLSKVFTQHAINGLHIYGIPNPNGTGNKTDTLGSRLLLKYWVRGVIVNHNDSVLNDTTLLFNYDKINSELVITRDMQAFMHVDRDGVKSFTLSSPQGNYTFYSVPEINIHDYFQLISTGEICTVYKKIVTYVKKPDYHTNGLVEYGNKYAEYVDDGVYYIMDVSGQNKFSGKFYLTKSSIRKVFGFNQEKLSEYFESHRKSRLDDNFVKGISDYFNQ